MIGRKVFGLLVGMAGGALAVEACWLFLPTPMLAVGLLVLAAGCIAAIW